MVWFNTEKPPEILGHHEQVTQEDPVLDNIKMQKTKKVTTKATTKQVFK